ncbi:uncharacterized protein LOC117282186 [Cryptotermes secundus]|uniref:uncharacterized protein LOC117282186 n=1 Tax=Cryptotermes secundus TaxID=105785 RepID=UPI001454CC8B|nr:uncharacterized protein LOC117282186 [Cryptotermes secundus]
MDSSAFTSTCCASFHRRNGEAGECKSDIFGRKGYVYIQPQPAKSCKPLNIYKKPTVSFEDGTVYNLSYIGNDADTAAQCRGRALQRRQNLFPAGHMSSETTYRHDYGWWPEAVPAESARPHSLPLFGGGPMESLSTQKHDYTPKPVTGIVNFGPYNNIRLSDRPMEKTTIARLSYQPIEKYIPTESCKPQAELHASWRTCVRRGVRRNSTDLL